MASNFHAGLAIWDYVVVALYGLWMLAIGAYYARRQTSLGEYFLGGRSMNPVIVGISTMATLVSTITYLTTPGEIIKNGFGVLWGMASIVPAFFLVGYLIIPRIMKQDVVSGYQLLEKQFGVGIRRAAAGLFVLTRIAWVGLVIYTCSVALSAMTGWRLESILVATGLVTTAYTVMGGIRAVMITDVAQAVILFIGAVGVVIFAMCRAGSPAGWWPQLSAPEVKAGLNWPHVPWFALQMSVRISVFGMILHQLTWWVLTAGSGQLAIQRYLSTRDARAARNSFLVNGIANTLVSVFLVLAGIALLGFFLSPSQAVPPLADLLPKTKAGEAADLIARVSSAPVLQQKAFVLAQGADKVFPWFIAHILPAGLSGLLLAALFSAAMSSVSSGINSITTILMVDFAHVFSRPQEEAARVRRAKGIGIA
ncbi:MAG: sodium:solute symporter family transporter, partial [Armatimonadota bacterium]